MRQPHCNGLALALLVVASAVNALATLARAQSVAPVPAGIYTEAQAIRGQTLYNEGCWQCHGETLAGLDQAPPLTGPQFASTWQGEPLAALVKRIDTMPPDRPGSLTRDESVDLLSYILWYNGLPYGEWALAADQAVLAELVFESPLLAGQ